MNTHTMDYRSHLLNPHNLQSSHGTHEHCFTSLAWVTSNVVSLLELRSSMGLKRKLCTKGHTLFVLEDLRLHPEPSVK